MKWKYKFDIDIEYRNGVIQHFEKFTIGGMITILKFFGESVMIKAINIKTIKNEEVQNME